ncbi:hypothetical protein DK842_11930 [Chromobacterium phragmitis]|uniref:CesD/SycD/LcrH family type III secretion system chaperone n=1 Tax=Chromobacterium phragmitis TaxID=2202141 RepID=A0A344UKX0_9NEIS|nr:hypothetical protein [Chromobacterium phragmitis]AXE30546.1 hypothetical protein DK842_11930 [Chromobacterium phragmitis]AXE35918.1 hypothetical protein DK843_17365 [Chromobacterium phragmitis]
MNRMTPYRMPGRPGSMFAQEPRKRSLASPPRPQSPAARIAQQPPRAREPVTLRLAVGLLNRILGTFAPKADGKPLTLAQYAAQLFDSGEFDEAKCYYLLLARLNHWQFDYWLRLGQCCQRLGEHDEAVACFGKAGLLKLEDPRPAHLARRSHRLASQQRQAPNALHAVVAWCASRPEHATLKEEVLRQARVNPQESLA